MKSNRAGRGKKRGGSVVGRRDWIQWQQISLDPIPHFATQYYHHPQLFSDSKITGKGCRDHRSAVPILCVATPWGIARHLLGHCVATQAGSLVCKPPSNGRRLSMIGKVTVCENYALATALLSSLTFKPLSGDLRQPPNLEVSIQWRHCMTCFISPPLNPSFQGRCSRGTFGNCYRRGLGSLSASCRLSNCPTPTLHECSRML